MTAAVQKTRGQQLLKSFVWQMYNKYSTIVRFELHPIDGVRFLRNVGNYVLKTTYDVIFHNTVSL